MKTYRQFIEQAIEAGKEMVVHTGKLKEIPNPEHESEKREVVQGVYEVINDMIGEDDTVHMHLSKHRDPHRLIGGILRGMGSSDQELIKKHRMDTPEGIENIHRTLSDKDYLKK